MPANFVRDAEGRPPSFPIEADAYIRVRVTSDRRADGSVLVYLPGGTGLIVNGDLLLYPDCSSPDRATLIRSTGG